MAIPSGTIVGGRKLPTAANLWVMQRKRLIRGYRSIGRMLWGSSLMYLQAEGKRDILVGERDLGVVEELELELQDLDEDYEDKRKTSSSLCVVFLFCLMRGTLCASAMVCCCVWLRAWFAVAVIYNTV